MSREGSLLELIAMGFERNAARTALDAFPSFDQALQFLLESASAAPTQAFSLGEAVLLKRPDGWVPGIIASVEPPWLQVQFLSYGGSPQVVNVLSDSEDLKTNTESKEFSSSDEQKHDPEHEISLPPDFPWIESLSTGSIEFRDWRDGQGVWIKASVLDHSGGYMATIALERNHEVLRINLIEQSENIAPFGTFCTDEVLECDIDRGHTIYCFSRKQKRWNEAEVLDISTNLRQVFLKTDEDESTYWFGVRDDCFSVEEYLEQISSPETPENMIQGSLIRVLDSRGYWCMASVRKSICQKRDCRILVHYDRWGSKFDEWLSLKRSSFRIRSLNDVDSDPHAYPSEEVALQQQADKEFKRKLNDLFGLDTIEVPADGNCLYTSFGYFAFPDDEKDRLLHHKEMRQLCFDHILLNSADFQNFISSSIEEYILLHGREGDWGGETEIVALSQALERPVHIFQQSAMKLPTITINDDKFKGKEPIRLSYHGKSHYNVVVELSKT
jgi:hypothetical protein